MAWIQVGLEADIAEGVLVVVEDETGEEFLVTRADGEIYAVANECSHDRRGFEGGCIEGGLLVCPRHGANFCLRTGAALTPPAYEAIATFPVKVEDACIWIDV